MSKFHETRGWSLSEKLAHYSARPNECGCTLWTAPTGAGGYGYLRWKGRRCTAHRLAWEAANGPIPGGMHVLHKCDVRACINPDHLFLGTSAENVADMVRKSRQAGPEGESNRGAKLTESQVYEIRAMPGRQRDIGARYGVNREIIGLIKRRKVWRHLP